MGIFLTSLIQFFDWKYGTYPFAASVCKINLLQFSVQRRWSLWYLCHGIRASIFKDCHLLLTQEGRKKWIYIAVRKLFVRQFMFLAVHMMKYGEETDCTETVQNIPDWRLWRTHCTSVQEGWWAWACFELGTALGVVPAQAPAGSCCGWEDGAENHHGDTGTPSSTFKGAYMRKVRFCMTFYWSSGFVKATVPVLQACSPTTRTRTATGSAALSVITILNSDWLELYPFMSTRQC